MRIALSFFQVAAAVAVTLFLVSAATAADSDGSGDIVMIQVAPDVMHFHRSPDYVHPSWLVGVEWQRASKWLGGYSHFRNSFGQRSQYIYGGKTWQLSETRPNWYLKVTAGALLGYEQPYEDKIPLNHNGVAPAIVPGLGYKYDRFNVQVNTLGVYGLMITFGYDLIR